MNEQPIETQPENDEFHSFAQSRTLYLILQGEFVMYYDKDAPRNQQLRILAPEVKDHCYIAGPWFGEAEIPLKLNLQLRNVRGGKVIPEDLSDTFLKLGVGVTPQYDKARVDIAAPLPLAILPGLMDDTTSVVMTVWDDHDNASHPPVAKSPTIIPVLVYKWYEDEEEPFLGSVHGNHQWCAGGTDSYRSIHVYASGREKESDEHSKFAFKKAASLLGVNASIDWLPGVPKQSTHVSPYPGLAWGQINLVLSQRPGECPDPRMLQDDVDEEIKRELALAAADGGNCGPMTGSSS